MAGARVRLTGHEEALAALGHLVARAAHPRGLFDEVGASLVTSTQVRFERGVAPDGSPWPPSIRALAQGGKTLIDTARLMNSITFIANDTSVEVGTNVIYAAIHQFGGAIAQPARKQTIYRRQNKRTGELSARFVRKGKSNVAQEVGVGAHIIQMPARPFLGLDDDDDREIVRIAEDWLRGGVQP